MIQPEESQKTVQILFLLGVTRVSADIERPIAQISRYDPDPIPLTVSGCLKNLTFDINYNFGALNLGLLNIGYAQPAYVAFEPRNPVYVNLNTDIPYVPREDRIPREVFRRIKDATMIEIVTKTSKVMVCKTPSLLNSTH